MEIQWRKFSIGVVAALMLSGVLWSGDIASSTENEPLTEAARAVLENYEDIQKALAADSTTGIAEGAASMAMAIRDDAGKSFPLNVAEEADQLAKAQDIDAARRAFKPLSASVIAWLDENKVESSGYQEAYCPMADAYWLQKEAEINNPYLGKKMLNCGEFDRHF